MASPIERLFIAISLPEGVKDQIERAQQELRVALPRESVRWAKPAQFHVTLKFLGGVASERLDALSDSVRRACEQFGTIQLRAQRIGVFPDFRRPRAIWAGVHDERERLPSLQRTVEMAAAGFTSEGPVATFTGHVTLGRCRTIKGSQGETLAKLVTAMKSRHFGDWTTDSIEVVRSELGTTGSRYTTLAVIPLAGGRK